MKRLDRDGRIYGLKRRAFNKLWVKLASEAAPPIDAITDFYWEGCK